MNSESINPNKKDTRNFDLLCDIAELTALFEKESSLSDFLKDVVHMVAAHMRADVCSVYLYNQAENTLFMRATKGLDPPRGVTISLKPGEGITGKAFEESRSIREGRANQNPFFKPIPGIEEEQYSAFLAVPIRRGVTKIGVLTLQDKRKNAFSSQDTRALKAIASQLAASLENAEVFMELYQTPVSSTTFDVSRVSGSSAGTNIAIGSAFILRTRSASFSPLPIPKAYGPKLSETEELTRFAKSLGQTKHQLETMQKELDSKVAEVADLIFSAHLLMLRDEKFSGAMQQKIHEGKSSELAVVEVVNHYVELFNNHENSRIREKAQDILDLGLRIVRNLVDHEMVSGDYSGQIIITPDVFPSELVKLSAQNAAGLVAFGSGNTAHIALLARSLGLPVLFFHDESVLSIPLGSQLILDGSHEELLIGPDEKVVKEYRQLIEQSEKIAAVSCPRESYTRDNRRIRVLANVNLIKDVEVAQECFAEGVGLYRSEFPFLVRNDFPSEEEQTRLYRRVLDPMKNKEVVIRTLDVGGDKLLGNQQQSPESNPFLGFRGIRFSLSNPEIFSDQLRAILRSGSDSDLSIMFPMVSSLDEFMAAKEFVRFALAELAHDGLEHNSEPKLGSMIELPAAVEIIGDLAEAADFLSVGTNDLIMYTLAVDRTNEQIGSMYTPHHPAVLRSLKRIIEGSGSKLDKLSICGEAVHDPALLTFLVGMGITKFSVDPNRIPRLKALIQNIDFTQAREIAEEMISIKTLKQMDTFISSRELNYHE